MILNIIEICDLKFDKKIIKILRILTSSLSLINKSFMISIFSFSTARYKAVL